MDLAGKFDNRPFHWTPQPPFPQPQPSLRGLRPWYRKRHRFLGYQHGSSSACRSSALLHIPRRSHRPHKKHVQAAAFTAVRQILTVKNHVTQDPDFFHLFVWWWLNHPFSWYQPCVLRTTMCASSKRNVNIPPPHPAPKTVYSTVLSNRRYGKLPRIGTRRVLCTVDSQVATLISEISYQHLSTVILIPWLVKHSETWQCKVIWSFLFVLQLIKMPYHLSGENMHFTFANTFHRSLNRSAISWNSANMLLDEWPGKPAPCSMFLPFDHLPSSFDHLEVPASRIVDSQGWWISKVPRCIQRKLWFHPTKKNTWSN